MNVALMLLSLLSQFHGGGCPVPSNDGGLYSSTRFVSLCVAVLGYRVQSDSGKPLAGVFSRLTERSRRVLYRARQALGEHGGGGPRCGTCCPRIDC